MCSTTQLFWKFRVNNLYDTRELPSSGEKKELTLNSSWSQVLSILHSNLMVQLAQKQIFLIWLTLFIMSTILMKSSSIDFSILPI